MEISIDDALTIQLALGIASEKTKKELAMRPDDEDYKSLQKRIDAAKQNLGKQIAKIVITEDI